MHGQYPEGKKRQTRAGTDEGWGLNGTSQSARNGHGEASSEAMGLLARWGGRGIIKIQNMKAEASEQSENNEPRRGGSRPVSYNTYEFTYCLQTAVGGGEKNACCKTQRGAPRAGSASLWGVHCRGRGTGQC